MSQDQSELVDEILAGFTPVGEGVPENFADFVRDRISSRPAPTPAEPLEALESRVAAIESKIDEVLDLLRGGNPQCP